MVDGVATEILCGICDEVCKRGARVKCCLAQACRPCAIVKISKEKQCFNEDCGKKISVANHLFNDMFLRKAVEHFNKDGKLKPAMEKQLAKRSEKREKTWTTVAEKFEQPCFKGNKCKLKGKACLFNHDNDEEPKPKADTPKPKKAGTPAKKGKKGTPAKKGSTPAKKVDSNPQNASKDSEDKAICKFGTNCTKLQCKFAHPGKVNKPCNYGASCSKTDCKFQHENEGLRRKMAKMSKLSSGGLGSMMSQMSKPMGMSGSLGSMMGGMGGGSDMMGYLEMEKMKSNLENMMQSFMGKNKAFGGRMGGRF